MKEDLININLINMTDIKCKDKDKDKVIREKVDFQELALLINTILIIGL